MAGRWQMRDGELISEGGADKRSIIELPYQPPTEYDFEIVFRRAEGHADVGQICSARGHQFRRVMDGWDGVCAFEVVRGKGGFERDTPTRRKISVTTGDRHTSVVKVRADRVRAYLDGKLISEWNTDYRD